METTIHPNEDGCDVLLTGRVDAHATGRLRDALRAGVASSTTRVDLSEVTFLDSAALAVLVSAHKEHVAAGGRFLLQRPSQPARIILEVTGLDRVLDVATAGIGA